MADGERYRFLNIDERRLSIIVFTLFSSWMLAFPFEGQILYALADSFHVDPYQMVFAAVAAHGVGLFFWGFLIKTKKTAKILMLCSIALCILVSVLFFFLPSYLWTTALAFAAFCISAAIVSWGYYFKSGTPKNERIKTAADVLIYSNILMILLNMAAIHLSPYIGLGLAILMLVGAFFSALLLPVHDLETPTMPTPDKEIPIGLLRPLALLCLFIVIITINSGLMYQVINPAFDHLKWLASWYWAIPYIVALYIMKNLSPKISRYYILYVAMAMIGLSFVAFMILDHSASSYLVVNTLMLGACGVFDLFWWSIIGEMLDLSRNPAKIFGIGLSANVLGVLIGEVIGNAMVDSRVPVYSSSALAFVVLCVTLTLLPLLHRYLSGLLTDHVFLSVWSEMKPTEQKDLTSHFVHFENLSGREKQVATLLLQGKTYRTIANELYISENTVKTHVKNIYSKFNIRSRAELIELIMNKDGSTTEDSFTHR